MLLWRSFASALARRRALEQNLKLNLAHIGKFSLDETQISNRNCENMIGATQVPLGIAGPLLIKSQISNHNDQKKQKYYIPLATTEGALVASVNRGCKAITESGGAQVAVELVGVTRGPVFKTSGINQSLQFKQWLDKRFSHLKKITNQTSSHLKLLKIDTQILNRLVYVRFYFDTTDAMGMNMVTFATDKIAKFIQQQTKAKLISLAGNFDIDKKPAWLNFISGRGKRVWAEVLLPDKIIRQTLKSCAEAIYQLWLSKCLLGSAISGSIGFNAHYANIIAAMFIACGQDPAHVVEGSLGITTVEVNDQDLFVSVYLPSLMVGIVGGGTGLPTQKEALQILGVAEGCEGEKALELAQVIGGAVLAGEISLLASLAEGSLAQAHQKLGRGKNSKHEFPNPK